MLRRILLVGLVGMGLLTPVAGDARVTLPAPPRWSEPVQMAGPILGYGGASWAVHDNARVTVAWGAHRWDSKEALWFRVLHRNGDLGPRTKLRAHHRGWRLAEPVIAALPDGGALAVWPRYAVEHGTVDPDGGWTIELRRIRRDGSVGPVRVVGEGLVIQPSVGVDPSGRAVVAWVNQHDPGDHLSRIEARVLGGAGADESFVLSSADQFYQPEVVIGASGHVVVHWAENGAVEANPKIWARRLGPGGTWGPEQLLSVFGAERAEPIVLDPLSVDGEGDARLVYRNGHEDPQLMLRQWPRGQEPLPPTRLASHVDPYEPSDLATNAEGWSVVSRDGAFSYIEPSGERRPWVPFGHGGPVAIAGDRTGLVTKAGRHDTWFAALTRPDGTVGEPQPVMRYLWDLRLADDRAVAIRFGSDIWVTHRFFPYN